MGCDIHLFTEKKVEGVWKAVKGSPIYEWAKEKWSYDFVYGGRNYYLFSLLADVRNNGNIEPFSHPRGLPENVSEIIAEDSDSWGYDGHSHSYYTLKELKGHLKKINNQQSDVLENFLKKSIPILEKLANGNEDSVRIVFWFDN